MPEMDSNNYVAPVPGGYAVVVNGQQVGPVYPNQGQAEQAYNSAQPGSTGIPQGYHADANGNLVSDWASQQANASGGYQYSPAAGALNPYQANWGGLGVVGGTGQLGPALSAADAAAAAAFQRQRLAELEIPSMQGQQQQAWAQLLGYAPRGAVGRGGQQAQSVNAQGEQLYNTTNGPKTTAQMRAELRSAQWPNWENASEEEVRAQYARTAGGQVAAITQSAGADGENTAWGDAFRRMSAFLHARAQQQGVAVDALTQADYAEAGVDAGMSPQDAGRLAQRVYNYKANTGQFPSTLEQFRGFAEDVGASIVPQQNTLQRDIFEEQQNQFRASQAQQNQQYWAGLMSRLSGPQDYFQALAARANMPADVQAQGLMDVFRRTPAFGEVKPTKSYEDFWAESANQQQPQPTPAPATPQPAPGPATPQPAPAPVPGQPGSPNASPSWEQVVRQMTPILQQITQQRGGTDIGATITANDYTQAGIQAGLDPNTAQRLTTSVFNFKQQNGRLPSGMQEWMAQVPFATPELGRISAAMNDAIRQLLPQLGGDLNNITPQQYQQAAIQAGMDAQRAQALTTNVFAFKQRTGRLPSGTQEWGSLVPAAAPTSPPSIVQPPQQTPAPAPVNTSALPNEPQRRQVEQPQETQDWRGIMTQPNQITPSQFRRMGQTGRALQESQWRAYGVDVPSAWENMAASQPKGQANTRIRWM